MFGAYRTCHVPVRRFTSTFSCGDFGAMLLIAQGAFSPSGSMTRWCCHDRVAPPGWNALSTISVSHLAVDLEQASPNA